MVLVWLSNQHSDTDGFQPSGNEHQMEMEILPKAFKIL